MRAVLSYQVRRDVALWSLRRLCRGSTGELLLRMAISPFGIKPIAVVLDAVTLTHLIEHAVSLSLFVPALA